MPDRTQARVLLVNNDARHFVTHRLSQARLLEEAGFEIHLAVPPHQGDLPFRTDEDRAWFSTLRRHPYALNRKSVNPLREAAALRQLRRIVRAVEPAVVHSVTPKGNVYGALAARSVPSVRGIVGTVTGLGFVFSSPSAKARLLRSIAARAYRRAFDDPRARVIFQNPSDRALFLEMGIVREAQARLVPGSGVDVDHFRVLPEPTGPFRAAFVGRLLRDKGVDALVAAARLAKERDPSIEVELVGDVDPGNPASFSREQVERWAREGVVLWSGPARDVRARLAEAHVAVLPSLREGVPMALLEAAACGRALVATDAPGCREAVRHEETGLLVPVGDARALAAALVRLAAEPETRRKMGLAARARAEQEFSKRRIASLVAEVYRECLEARP